MKGRKLLFIGILLGAILSCEPSQNHKPKAGEVVVAAINKEYLYLSQIPVITEDGISKSDSINFLNQYRDNWLKEKLVIEQAKLNLSQKDRREINQEVIDFENESYQYRYEKKFIQQKFDTMNLRAEIDSFYKENLESYTLVESIAQFILVAKSARVSEDSIKKWVLLEEDYYKIEDLCSELLLQCHMDTKKWFAIKSLTGIIDISEKELIEQLKEEELVLLKTAQGEFYFYVLSLKKAGEATPLSFVEDDIRTLVINKRKINFIGNLRNELYEEALRKGKIEIY